MGQAQGSELPFQLGECYSCLAGKSIWEAHSGTKKDSGDPVTVFVFDHAGKSPDQIKLAQAAYLRLKTLRHPNILKFIDGIELPTTIYMVTEEAKPLEQHLSSTDGRSQFSLSWGLHQLLKGLSFLTGDCGLVHGNVGIWSVFVDSAGEWKIGGVEFMSSEPRSVAPLPALTVYAPFGHSKRAEKWSVDMWGLGCLLWEVYNGQMTNSSELSSPGKIPKALSHQWSRLVAGNPRARPKPSAVLDELREPGAFLAGHHVSIALSIEELQIMEPAQRNDFFTYLNKHLDSFPKNFSKCKILPQLLNAFEFGGAGSSVLAPLFRLGALLGEAEYQQRIVPCVIKMFSSTDRATRLNLLKQLDQFIGNLHSSTVNQIFPKIADGFSDTVPAMREQTVKAMVLVAPRLSGAAVFGQLLRHLAKVQMDEVPAIRVNTNICLGKIASHIEPGTRKKVLATAFIRALKDPFPAARSAAVSGMAGTLGFYSRADMAGKLLPALCPMTLDSDKGVRDQVFSTIKLYLERLQRISDDPQAAVEQEKAEAAGSVSWAGWAVSSLTAKFYKGPSSERPPTAQDTQAEERKPQNRASEQNNTVSNKSSGTVEERKWEEPSGGESPSPEQEVVANDSSDMEGWDDDGWSDQPQPSAGADFFDTFHSSSSAANKPSTSDFFSNVDWPSGGVAKKEKTPPPPVSADLFGGSGDGWGEEADGWDNWTSEPSQPQDEPIKSSGWDDANWGSPEPTPSKEARQEELARKREERKQRQQAAREKRAAGGGRRPGLGAVKTD